jgi:hypothetical protein
VRVQADELPDGHVLLRLSKAEALVLFEWIHHAEQQDTALAQLGLVDQAEQRVLWDLSASLESALAEPFLPNYAEVIASARGQLRDSLE